MDIFAEEQKMIKDSILNSTLDVDSVITEEEKVLMEEIKKDPEALQRLKDKAQWEHMSLFAILKEWGDPRTWNTQ